jgi:N-acetyl-gamma-glutamylphosphate reductase
MNEIPKGPVDPVPMMKQSDEEAEAQKQADIKKADIAEMSINRIFIIEKAMVISMVDGVTAAIPSGKSIEVAQSVRNPGAIVIHLSGDNARIFGTGKQWTEEKIYSTFGKKYHETIQAWDTMVNELAITDLPE